MSWPTTRFDVGTEGVGLVSRRTLGLLMTDDPSLRTAVWDLVAADVPLDEILERLSIGGLRHLPSFGLAREEDEGIRVIARGAVRVEVVVDSTVEPVHIDGAATRTWWEEIVPGATAVSMWFDEAGHARVRAGGEVIDDAPDGFQVLAGMVPARSLQRAYVDLGAWPVPVADDWHAVARSPGRPSTRTPARDQASDHDPEIPDTSGTPPVDGPPEVVLHAPPSDVPAVFADGTTLLPTDVAELGFVDPPTSVGVDEEVGYDQFFGATVARSVQTAAVHLAPETESPEGPSHDERRAPWSIAPSPGPDGTGLIDRIPTADAGDPALVDGLGDHDGRTISKAQLARLRNDGTATSAVATTAGNGPLVSAVLCPNGHANAPHAGACRICRAQIAGAQDVLVPRPTLGVLRFSTGRVEPLDRPQLIGRNPRVEGAVPGGELPNLVKLEDAGQGVSRRHASVRIEGFQVLIEDLNSANGTIVSLPGRPAQRLRAGEVVILEPGTVVDLGGEVTFSFEVAP